MVGRGRCSPDVLQVNKEHSRQRIVRALRNSKCVCQLARLGISAAQSVKRSNTRTNDLEIDAKEKSGRTIQTFGL